MSYLNQHYYGHKKSLMFPSGCTHTQSIWLTREAETARHLSVYVLQVVGHMMTCPISTVIVPTLAGRLLPVILTDSLLHNSSHLLSRLAPVDEDVHISKGYAVLEVKSL